MSSIDWFSVLSTNLTADVLWTTFRSILNCGIELFVPCHDIKINNVKRKYPKTIRKLMCNKQCAWRASKRQPHNADLANKYSKLAYECKQAMQLHEIELENRVVESKNIGTFYKYVNKKMAHPSGIGVLYGSNNSPVVDDLSKAELLNSYLESVYTDDNNVLPPFDSRVSAGTRLDNTSFSQQSIYNTIKKLLPRTTCDPEGY